MNTRIFALAAAFAMTASTAFGNFKSGSCAPGDNACAADVVTNPPGNSPADTMTPAIPPPPGIKWKEGSCELGVCQPVPDDSSPVKKNAAPAETAAGSPGRDMTASAATGPGYNDGTDVADALGLSGPGDARRSAQGAEAGPDADTQEVRRADGNVEPYKGYTFLGTINAANKLQQYSADKPGPDFAAPGRTPDVNAGTPLTPPLTHVESNEK